MYLGTACEMLCNASIRITIDCGVDADWTERRRRPFVSPPKSEELQVLAGITRGIPGFATELRVEATGFRPGKRGFPRLTAKFIFENERGS